MGDRFGENAETERIFLLWQKINGKVPARSKRNLAVAAEALADHPKISDLTSIKIAELDLVPSLVSALAVDPLFNDWRPHHITMARLKMSLKEPIKYSWLENKKYGPCEKLKEWVDRYAHALESTLGACIEELNAIRTIWMTAELKPKSDPNSPPLHNELAAMGEIRDKLAQGEFLLPASVYQAVSSYELQVAIALSVIRSWCMQNGLPVLFDGLSITHVLNSPEESVALPAWEQAACAPFLTPSGVFGSVGYALDKEKGGAYAVCLTGESSMPVNYGYPLPPGVFEDYAKLCYRLVVNEQHPQYVRSDRYSAFSNILLAWYFQKGLSVAEISRRLNLAPSTTQRQLDNLIELFNKDLPEGSTKLQRRERPVN